MIQSRQQRGRRKKRGGRTIVLVSALVVGVGITAAAVWLPKASGPAKKPDSTALPQRSEKMPGEADKPKDAAQPAPSGEAGAKQGGQAASGPGPGTAPEGGSAGSGKFDKAPAESSGDSGGVPRVRMSFVGDVMLADNVEQQLLQNGYDYPYTNVKSLLSEPDLTIANLETPVTERGTKQTKEYVYRSSPKALPALKEAGVDLVNLANNHVMDYGAEGLLDTMSYLDQIGISHVGTGRDLNEALQPVIVNKHGMTIAFLGFSRVVPNSGWKAGPKQTGVADTYDYEIPVDAIRKAKGRADLVVVLAHWGTERKDTPDPVQTDLAHRYVEAGADLVVASHPHVLQGLESYKGKWIAYSLGNFIFTTNEVAKTWDTIVLQADCGKNGSCSLSAVPILTKWAKPEPLTGNSGMNLLERLSSLSFGARIGPDGQVIPDTTAHFGVRMKNEENVYAYIYSQRILRRP